MRPRAVILIGTSDRRVASCLCALNEQLNSMGGEDAFFAEIPKLLYITEHDHRT